MPLKILFFLLISFISLNLLAQNEPVVGTPAVSYYNDTLKIVYKLSNCKEGIQIKIDLNIYDSNGSKINASKFSGDIGDNVRCGDNLTIFWDLAADNFQVNDEVQIEVIASRVLVDEPVIGRPEIVKHGLSRAKILASSIVLPGLGQKKAKGKSSPLLLGAAGYGALAATGYFALENKKYYGKYLEETDMDQRDQYFSMAEDRYDMLKVSAIAAAGIWTVNLIWAAIIPYEQNQKVALGMMPTETGGVGLYARWNF